MHSTIFFVLGALATLASAIPTPVSNAPRCGTTIYPSIMQIFKESEPTRAFSNSVSTPGTGRFTVSQTISDGKVTDRVLQGVAFSNIPAGSYACQLGFTFPASATITETSNAVLNVTTLLKGKSDAIVAGNSATYNDIFAHNLQDIGLFGTVGPFHPGQTVAVNSEECKDGGNLAFLFSIASWIGGPASMYFEESLLQGVYLTYNC